MTASHFAKSISAKKLYAMGASAALAASLFIAIPALEASTPVAAAKSDLADVQDCELRSWPYYARACLRDNSRNAGRAVTARVVTTDRVTTERFTDRQTLQAEIHVEANVEQALAHMETSQLTPSVEAPSEWIMSQRDVGIYLAAGDFIRRTVR